MIISKLKRLQEIVRKTPSFYKKNGFRLTLLEIRNRLIRRIRKVDLPLYQDLHPYHYLVKKFPQRFIRFKNPPNDIREWSTIIDSAAQLDLQNLLIQLDIVVDTEKILPLIKSNLGEDKYLHLLDNIFTLAQL